MKRWLLCCSLAIACTSPWQDVMAGPLQDRLDLPPWLRMSGSTRVRYEHLGGQFRPGLPPDDHALSLRTTLRTELGGERITALLELIDSRMSFERDGGVRSTGEVNALEPVQALVRWTLAPPSEGQRSAELSLGRFTLDLGSRRLVGSNSFRNTTNAFAGLLLRAQDRASRRVVAAIAMPQERRPTARDAIERDLVQLDRQSPDQAFGLLWVGGLRGPHACVGEVTVLGLRERDSASLATRNRRLLSLGLRFSRAPRGARVEFEFESIGQFGTRRATASSTDMRDLDVFAWMLHASLAHRPHGSSPWKFGAGLDAASGDHDPQDHASQRFDQLFGPRRGDWGPTGLFGPLGAANVVSPFARVDWSGAGRWAHFARHRVLWLAQERDTFASTGVVDATGASGRFAGQLFEVRTRYWLVRERARLELGSAALWRGRFLREAPNAADHGDSWYAHADLEFWF